MRAGLCVNGLGACAGALCSTAKASASRHRRRGQGSRIQPAVCYACGVSPEVGGTWQEITYHKDSESTTSSRLWDPPSKWNKQEDYDLTGCEDTGRITNLTASGVKSPTKKGVLGGWPRVGKTVAKKAKGGAGKDDDDDEDSDDEEEEYPEPNQSTSPF